MKKLIILILLSTWPISIAHGESSLNLLKQLVLINSESKNISGVNQVQEIVASKLKDLGFKVSFIENPNGKNKSGKLLVGTLPGIQNEQITLVTHADTVFDQNFTGFEVSKNQDKAKGPGVLDNKGGLVVALEGLKLYLSKNKPLYSLRFISSPSEEIGSPGFLDLFRKYGKDSFMILGFEPSLANGSIIESRRGNRWYHIKVSGKEGHAGRSHKDGINACHELAMKIDQLQQLTNYEKNVTVSIGHIKGGKDKFNIICGEAEAKIDTRFSEIDHRDQLHKKIQEILSKSYVKSASNQIPAVTKFELADDCPPFSITETSKPYLTKYKHAIEKIEGKAVKSEKSGGAADSNYMSRKDLIVIDGLGPNGAGMHTKDETILLSSLKTRSQALALFLESLAN